MSVALLAGIRAPEREASLTEIAHIEHLNTAVFGDTSKQLTIGAGGNGYDGGQMRTVVFNEFNPLLLFLPELEMAVNGGSN